MNCFIKVLTLFGVMYLPVSNIFALDAEFGRIVTFDNFEQYKVR